MVEFRTLKTQRRVRKTQQLPSEELTLASSKICSEEFRGIRAWRKKGRTGRAGRNTEALSEHSILK